MAGIAEQDFWPAFLHTHKKKKLSASYNFLEPIIKVSEEGDSYKFNREAEDAGSRSGEKQKSQK